MALEFWASRNFIGHPKLIRGLEHPSPPRVLRGGEGCSRCLKSIISTNIVRHSEHLQVQTLVTPKTFRNACKILGVPNNVRANTGMIFESIKNHASIAGVLVLLIIWFLD